MGAGGVNDAGLSSESDDESEVDGGGGGSTEGT